MNIDHQVIPASSSQSLIAESMQMKQSKDNCTKKSSPAILLYTILLLVSLNGLFTPVVHAANLLFRTNFGPGVSVNAPTGYYGKGAWQRITGTDQGNRLYLADANPGCRLFWCSTDNKGNR
ncbi:MAG: hypothetical protein IPP22_12480 [Nitrosomonas sp.]|nr:hypothetical protein [Nitrosomonas sp.]